MSVKIPEEVLDTAYEVARTECMISRTTIKIILQAAVDRMFPVMSTCEVVNAEQLREIWNIKDRLKLAEELISKFLSGHYEGDSSLDDEATEFFKKE